jgi:metal-responsive CopG/Arc/MetJ family transcriptional regulator
MYERMDNKITVKVSKELLEELDAYAIEHGVSRSEAVREAIIMMLKEEQKRTTLQMRVEKGYRIR